MAKYPANQAVQFTGECPSCEETSYGAWIPGLDSETPPNVLQACRKCGTPVEMIETGD